jgi:hypothetical protein
MAVETQIGKNAIMCSALWNNPDAEKARRLLDRWMCIMWLRRGGVTWNNAVQDKLPRLILEWFNVFISAVAVRLFVFLNHFDY